MCNVHTNGDGDKLSLNWIHKFENSQVCALFLFFISLHFLFVTQVFASVCVCVCV